MKTHIAPHEEILSSLSGRLIDEMKDMERVNLLVCTGPDEIALLEKMSALCIQRQISLENVSVLCACEFSGLEKSDERSCFSRVKKALAGSGITDITDPSEHEDYDAYIASAGGIDIAIVGIGFNGAVAFNEPGVQYGSYTHLQKLTVKTAALYAEVFGDRESVPEYGMTAGIKTLVSARNIRVIALGESRAAPVYLMLYARDDSVVPAAFLQLPMNVDVYLDKEAASRL